MSSPQVTTSSSPIKVTKTDGASAAKKPAEAVTKVVKDASSTKPSTDTVKEPASTVKELASTIKEPASTAKEVAQKPAFSLKRWWEPLLTEPSLTEEWHEYLQELTKPWCKQEQVILTITEAINKGIDSEKLSQPLIHFNGPDIYISSLAFEAILDLWKNPPLFRGKPMQVVFKALPYQKPFATSFANGRAMKKAEFVEAFEKQYEALMAKTNEEYGLMAAYARFYQVEGLSGEPVFSGQVVMISKGIDVAQTHKPFFLTKAEGEDKKLFIFKNPGETRRIKELRSK